MKRIITALALIAFAFTSAEAQYCKPMHSVKHAGTVYHHKKKPVNQSGTGSLTTQSTFVTSCKLVPYDVCKISADHKSVTCYKSMDPDELTPLYPGEFTYYDNTGVMPGEDERPTIETVVIKGVQKADYCKRNSADNATVCYINNTRLTRDNNGFYHY